MILQAEGPLGRHLTKRVNLIKKINLPSSLMNRCLPGDYSLQFTRGWTDDRILSKKSFSVEVYAKEHCLV